MKRSHIYIMANKMKTTLYVGVTSDLMMRIADHKNKRYPNSFTAKYNCNILLYFSEFSAIRDAIAEEKRIKRRSQAKKIALINEKNPEWLDIAIDW